jgi:hypothetical protein
MKRISLSLVCMMLLAFGCAEEKGIKIVEKNEKFHLMIDGVDTYIKEPGNYRLYVYVLDGTGFVSTANANKKAIMEFL